MLSMHTSAAGVRRESCVAVERRAEMPGKERKRNAACARRLPPRRRPWPIMAIMAGGNHRGVRRGNRLGEMS